MYCVVTAYIMFSKFIWENLYILRIYLVGNLKYPTDSSICMFIIECQYFKLFSYQINNYLIKYTDLNEFVPNVD